MFHVFTVKFQLERLVKMADAVKRTNRLPVIAPNVFIIQAIQFSMKVSSSGHAAPSVQPILRHLWTKKVVRTASTNGSQM